MSSNKNELYVPPVVYYIGQSNGIKQGNCLGEFVPRYPNDELAFTQQTRYLHLRTTFNPICIMAAKLTTLICQDIYHFKLHVVKWANKYNNSLQPAGCLKKMCDVQIGPLMQSFTPAVFSPVCIGRLGQGTV